MPSAEEKKKRSQMLMTGMAVGGLALVGVFGYLYFSNQSSSSSPSSETKPFDTYREVATHEDQPPYDMHMDNKTILDPNNINKNNNNNGNTNDNDNDGGINYSFPVEEEEDVEEEEEDADAEEVSERMVVLPKTDDNAVVADAEPEEEEDEPPLQQSQDNNNGHHTDESEIANEMQSAATKMEVADAVETEAVDTQSGHEDVIEEAVVVVEKSNGIAAETTDAEDMKTQPEEDGNEAAAVAIDSAGMVDNDNDNENANANENENGTGNEDAAVTPDADIVVVNTENGVNPMDTAMVVNKETSNAVEEEVADVDDEKDMPESNQSAEEVEIRAKIAAHQRMADEVAKYPVYEYKDGELQVQCISATNLDDLDKNEKNSVSDPFVKFKIGKEKAQETTFIKDNLNPVWNESFVFRVKDTVRDELECVVWDKDKFTKNDKIGTVVIPVIDVAAQSGYMKKEFAVEGSKTGGKLLLELKYVEYDASNNNNNMPAIR